MTSSRPGYQKGEIPLYFYGQYISANLLFFMYLPISLKVQLLIIFIFLALNSIYYASSYWYCRIVAEISRGSLLEISIEIGKNPSPANGRNTLGVGKHCVPTFHALDIGLKYVYFHSRSSSPHGVFCAWGPFCKLRRAKKIMYSPCGPLTFPPTTLHSCSVTLAS